MEYQPYYKNYQKLNNEKEKIKMLETKNELAVFESEKDVYCSMPTESIEDRKLVARALEKSDVLLNDCEGQSFNLKGFYLEKKMIAELDAKNEPVTDENGVVKVRPKYRTILFADDGKTYASGAYGVYSSIKSMVYVFGNPNTWLKPIPVTVKKPKLKDGKTSLKLEF